MDATRRPSELNATTAKERSIAEERNVFCVAYDSCLEVAVQQGWASWTCVLCPVFAAGPAVDALERYAQTRVACAWPG